MLSRVFPWLFDMSHGFKALRCFTLVLAPLIWGPFLITIWWNHWVLAVVSVTATVVWCGLWLAWCSIPQRLMPLASWLDHRVQLITMVDFEGDRGRALMFQNQEGEKVFWRAWTEPRVVQVVCNPDGTTCHGWIRFWYPVDKMALAEHVLMNDLPDLNQLERQSHWENREYLARWG